MSTMCVGLENPGGVISKHGRDDDGATSEADLISAVTVPAGDAHHLTDFEFSVAEGAQDTRFRLYGRAASTDSWTRLQEFEVNRHGTLSITLGTSHKFKAAEQWKLSVVQATGGRCSVRVGGQAKGADTRDF